VGYWSKLDHGEGKFSINGTRLAMTTRHDDTSRPVTVPSHTTAQGEQSFGSHRLRVDRSFIDEAA
jgi:hypothetical protein